MLIRHVRLCDNRGTPYPFVNSPNKGDTLEHKYVVIHYTALPDADLAIKRLSDPEVGVSSHLVIDREGKITQLVPFNEVAWHAGESSWMGQSGLNRCSIGIELDNAGRLEKVDGRWQSWSGNEYLDGEVIEAVHKNSTVLAGWHVYPEVQVETALQVVRLLVQRFRLLDVLGHDEISPNRKWDPGPAFPMESFREKALRGLEGRS